MEEQLKLIQSKLNKIKLYGAVGDDDKVIEIIQSISEDDLELMEISAKALIQMVKQIKIMKEELK